MSIVAPKPPGRRILTFNVPLSDDAQGVEAEPAVSVSITEVAGESSLGGAAIRASVGNHTSIPVPQEVGVSMPDLGILSAEKVRNGVNVTINDLAPGECVPMHRTSTIDYATILTPIYLQTPSTSFIPETSESGLSIPKDIEIVETLCQPGDVVVQRGTLHGWRNPSTTEWSRLVGVGIGAEVPLIEVVNGVERRLEGVFYGL